MFVYKTSHYVASWYRQPYGTSEDFQLLRDRLDHIRGDGRGGGGGPQPPLSSHFSPLVLPRCLPLAPISLPSEYFSLPHRKRQFTSSYYLSFTFHLTIALYILTTHLLFLTTRNNPARNPREGLRQYK